MEGVEPQDARYDVSCPHCKKTFTGELLVGAASRYRGFKCPHCRLFVPHERVEDAELAVGQPDAASH